MNSLILSSQYALGLTRSDSRFLSLSLQVPDVSSLGSSSQMALQSSAGNPPDENSVVTLLLTPFQLDYQSAFGSSESTQVSFQPSLAAVGRGRTVRNATV
jgi:hypothetical protein